MALEDEAPLRSEIHYILASIPVDKKKMKAKDKKERNEQRKDSVHTFLTTFDKKTREKIMSDLESYEAWEVEKDEPEPSPTP